jgi:hypothetical protein
VQAALESDLAGDVDRRRSLLQQALRAAPDDGPTRWQAGYVRHGDAWLPADEVARQTQQDARLAEYARLRAATATTADEAALARWCVKNRLPDEARAHWLAVLAAQPGDPEALAALGLRSFQGRWLTAEQIGRERTRMNRVERAADEWRPLVARWRREAERIDGRMPAEVATRIAAIAEEAEMLALQRELSRQFGATMPPRIQAVMGRQLVAALAENRHPLAAAALAQLAVFGEPGDVRAAAAAALAPRPLDDFVPLLLSGLRMPLEATVATATGPLGFPLVRYGLVQEGMLGDGAVSLLVAPEVQGQITIPDEASGAYLAEDLAAFERSRSDSWGRAAGDVAAFGGTVARANAAIAKQNRRIYAALAAATGREIPDSPAAWWTWWWQDHNEMFVLDGGSAAAGGGTLPKPVQERELYAPYPVSVPQARSFGGPTEPWASSDPGTSTGSPGNPPWCECFARGTPVWTLTGLVPIEEVKRGDRVLAQDPDSGELAYKPVLGVTIRPPGPRLKLGLDGEAIVATPGHPFWVHGRGWGLAKQLQAGDRLHALGGGVAIDAITAVPTPVEHYEQAYNLVVADFPSYFVGRRGLLVHDNTPRAPTTTPLPGLTRPALRPCGRSGTAVRDRRYRGQARRSETARVNP